MNYGNCVICGKPTMPPNCVLSGGLPYHIFCLCAAYRDLKAAHSRLQDKLHASGFYGPWSDDWAGSYEENHWDNLTAEAACLRIIRDAAK